MADRKLAVVTGASTGIGLELARCCAEDGYALVIAANEPGIHVAAETLREYGVPVEAVEADLGSKAGIDALTDTIGERSVAALIANAGRGLGEPFLDQDFWEAKALIDLNLTGTLLLIQRIGRRMRERNSGRILITGSIAGFMPGSHQAVYNATKAFLDSFSYALRNELQDSEVTVTCLMPGPTETEFFARAGMEDTPVGQSDKADPAKVARDGYSAMHKGEAGIVSGLMNKVQAAFSDIIPDKVLAEMHRRMADHDRQE